MKVGILSMQRVPNYGSFLQAYGLKKTIESLGHQVYFIDYIPGKPIDSYHSLSQLKYKIQSLAPIVYLNDAFKYYVLRRNNFAYIYHLKYLKLLGVGYRHTYHKKADIAVIGSDEVFNCTQSGYNVGFSHMLFGEGIHADKVISYAASFGYTDVRRINHFGIEKELTGLMRNFAAISVRDQNSSDTVKFLTDKTPVLNLDPVLISDYEIPEINTPFNDYIILYTYKSRKYSDVEKKQIIDFCHKYGKKLISIGAAQDWVDEKIETNPFEMLAWFKHADFIITDTFHGTVFSIKYNLRFATLVREDNKQKLDDLLIRLHKTDREISFFSELQEMYEKPADFSKTNRIIASEKEKTYEYLKKNLQL